MKKILYGIFLKLVKLFILDKNSSKKKVVEPHDVRELLNASLWKIVVGSDFFKTDSETLKFNPTGKKCDKVEDFKTGLKIIEILTHAYMIRNFYFISFFSIFLYIFSHMYLICYQGSKAKHQQHHKQQTKNWLKVKRNIKAHF